MRPGYIVVHTSASGAVNQDVRMLRSWHRRKGWSDIGYHYVIFDDNRAEFWEDGRVAVGRPSNTEGAHCRGLNSESIGICCIGDGDHVVWTARQLDSLLWLCDLLMARYEIGVDNVIGHSEVNQLVDLGRLPAKYRTDKSCPGARNSMAQLRAILRSVS